ncbi:HesA/MoeB/ThiF family protein [Argonema antarcticum]|uniref:HesA/MoeB/ThiF family protein n=1 Tax=Argonema antarcticum TaxID=2942763 RepID=UPI0020122F94|nr:ThiF family adenylyltransferase [Argonema antarcticum]MCL1471005.1 ThiF family adenylyltransferase [Argonema antarcticum A004/B2]
MDFLEITAEPESRYERHYLIDWWDQEKLKAAKVLVAGAGALGNEVLKNLALVGIGNITVIDFDTVSITNLTRSVLFRESDVGLPKVEVARQRILEINPEISIQAIYGDLEFDLGIGDVREHDIIIGCLDSINARWAINQLAYRAGIPWINGGIGIAEGEISFFDPKTEAACYECTISDQMWERRNKRYSCQGLKRNIPEAAMPTTAPIASITSAMQVHQALLYLHGKTGFINPGEKVFLGLNPWTTFKVQIRKSEDCLAHDLSIEPIMRVNYEPNWKLEEVLKLLANSEFSEPVLWLRNEVIGKMKCLTCDDEEQVNTHLHKYPESQLSCPKCGHEQRDFEVIKNLTLDDSSANLTLGELCLTKNEILHCETSKGQIAIQFCQI